MKKPPDPVKVGGFLLVVSHALFGLFLGARLAPVFGAAVVAPPFLVAELALVGCLLAPFFGLDLRDADLAGVVAFLHALVRGADHLPGGYGGAVSAGASLDAREPGVGHDLRRTHALFSAGAFKLNLSLRFNASAFVFGLSGGPVDLHGDTGNVAGDVCAGAGPNGLAECRQRKQYGEPEDHGRFAKHGLPP